MSSDPTAQALPTVQDRPTAEQGRGRPDDSADFFRKIESLGIVREDDRWVAGVCAGLGKRFGLDPILVRGLVVALAVAGGFGLGLYGLAWALLPQTNGVIHLREVMRGRVSSGFIGAVFCVLLDMGSLTGRSLGYAGPFWSAPSGLPIVIIIGLGLWWLASSGRLDQRPAAGPPTAGTPAGGPSASWSAPAPASSGTAQGTSYPTATSQYARPGRPQWRRDNNAPLHSLTSTVFGTALLAGGGVLLWDQFISSFTDSPGVVALAVALAVVAGGVVLAGAMGRRSGALAPLTILLTILTLVAAVTPGDSQDAVWRPLHAAQASENYRLGAGRAMLDLTAPELMPAVGQPPLQVSVEVGIGELEILLPQNTSAQVRSSVGMGSVNEHFPASQMNGVLKDKYDGVGIHRTSVFGSGGAPQVIVEVNLGVGGIEIYPVQAVTSDE